MDSFLKSEHVLSHPITIQLIVAHATSIPESVFLSHLLTLWKQFHLGDYETDYLYDESLGMRIRAKRFGQETGLSVNQVRSLSAKYEKLGIVTTAIIKEYGCQKYYWLNEEVLAKYLHKQIKSVKDMKWK
jgi:hypothetical protein